MLKLWYIFEKVTQNALRTRGGKQIFLKNNLKFSTKQCCKGSRKKLAVLFLVARPLRGGGGKGLATKKKELI